MPYGLLTRSCFLLPKFDNSSPSVTRDKQICQSHVFVMMSLSPEAEYPMEHFE